jgi:hypothetical protein
MMPFIPTPQTFLSLALCGSIRDSIVPPPLLADYLLYHLNLHDPHTYLRAYNLDHPTNDVNELLAAVARKTGKLLRGGYVDEGAAAMDAITRFRHGDLGAWPVDRVTPDAFDLRIKEEVRARQREYRGTLGEKAGSGTMGKAIKEGREAATKTKPRTKKKGGAGGGGKGGKKVAGAKSRKAGGTRKTINRNRGTKSKKQRKR